MRILIMVHNLTGGGAERVAALWAEGFVSKGYEVAIAVDRNKKSQMTYPIPSTIRIFELDSWWKNGLTYRLFKICDFYHPWKIRKIYNIFKPDIIIGVLSPYARLAYKALHHNTNVKLVNTEHNSFEMPDYEPMKEQVRKEKFEENLLYDHVTILTQADKKCFDYPNVSVLPNPLAFPPIKEVPVKDNIILAAGRLDAWHCKGFDLLIKAWSLLCVKYPNWKLQIAGGGGKKYFDLMNKMIVENHVSNQTILLGFCNQMVDLYKKASIFVMPSRYEGFGMVLIEAMSQGCACIASDFRGRQKEIISNEDEGIICPSDDVESLVEAIEKLIIDKKYRMELQKNAIIRSNYYSLDNTMNRWDYIFRKMHLI